MKSPRFSVTNLDQSQQRPNKLSLALIATTFIAASQLLAVLSASANPVPTPSEPNPLIPTRGILNGSFEQPVIKNWVGAPTNSSVAGSDVTGSGLAGGNILEGYNSTPGLPVIWQSTDRGNGPTRGNYNYKDSIEVWRGVNTGNGGQPETSGAGQQHAELNGSDDAALYQDVCVLPGETVGWSLLHAVRFSDKTNKMQVSITDPVAWNDSKIPPTTQLYNSGDLSTTYADGWKSKTGTWQSTNTSVKKLRFAFQAIQGSGNNSVGNFIDDVRLSFSPFIDFLPTAENVNLAITTEGNPSASNRPYYYLSLRINGELKSSGSVKINLTGLNQYRQFTLGSVLKGTAAATAGLTATKSGAQITLNIPAGIYDPNVVSNYIHIPIDFSDTIKKPNDNLVFTLSNPTGGGSSALEIGSGNCGGAARTTVNTLLKDDDYIRRL
jgi:trimeric autotransporter adhesin